MAKKIWIVTLFPQLFDSFKDVGVIGRSFNSREIEINFKYLGDFSPKSFKGVDSSPYGGGPGMVMRADVLESAVKDIQKEYLDSKKQLKVIYTAPRGEVFNNLISKSMAHDFVENEVDYIFICGRYEGIDERFITQYVDQIYSLGDFVLSGGELAVMCVIDSFLRFVDGVLGNSSSASDDSFEDGLIEGPQYTRPSDFNGEMVPDVLTSGDHKKISEYRLQKRMEFTKKLRPDLLLKNKEFSGK